VLIGSFIALHLAAVSLVTFSTPLSPVFENYTNLLRLGRDWGMYDTLPMADRHVFLRGELRNGSLTNIPFPGQTWPDKVSFGDERERYFLKALSMRGGTNFREELGRHLCRTASDLESVSLIVASASIDPLHEWQRKSSDYAEEEIFNIACSSS